jgi:sortase A
MSKGAGRFSECVFLVAGLLMLDYYIWQQASTGVYQDYSSWAFDRELRGQPAPVAEFVRDELARLMGRQAIVNENGRAENETPAVANPPSPPTPKRLPEDAMIGRVAIPRLGLQAIVREGTDAGTLERSVGHVPFTALPGESGNVAIAAHRDTFFRGLGQIRPDDVITFSTLQGRYRYQVEYTRVVSPKDVSVVAPTHDAELTLITCYPFHYIGSAPNRFIVRAKQIAPEAPEMQDAAAKTRPAKRRAYSARARHGAELPST